MKVAITFNRHAKTVRITCDGHVIDAPWNYFDDVESAREYFESKEMKRYRGCKYGIAVTGRDLWDFVETE